MFTNLKKAIQAKDFLVTCELAPPKGHKTKELIEYAASLKGLVHAINITDGQGGNMRMNSVIASYLVQRDAKVETICQMVCRDRNVIGLQADILGASALGINNFLALHGDQAAGGDHPEAKDVFDISTEGLLKVFKEFEKGLDYAGNKLSEPVVDLCVGAAAHPGVPDLKAQAEKMKLRNEAGVDFFQTQIVYDLEQLKRFLGSINGVVQAPVLIGITPLKGLKMAKFMNEKVYGVSVPQNIFERLENTSDQRAEGLKIALELVTEAKKLGSQGVHIMAVGQEAQLTNIIEQVKLVSK
jgi:methylenetetrahydrofolate reductase (NADPH)